jgi:hypothetical protein
MGDIYQDLTIVNKLKGKLQYARKSWHLEVASKHASRMKSLVKYAKEQGCMEQLWGRHAHLTNVTNATSMAREAKRQVALARAHTNYQMSMMAKELLGVISVEESADLVHPVTKAKVASFSLHYVLLNILKMKDKQSMIAEV